MVSFFLNATRYLHLPTSCGIHNTHQYHLTASWFRNIPSNIYRELFVTQKDSVRSDCRSVLYSCLLRPDSLSCNAGNHTYGNHTGHRLATTASSTGCVPACASIPHAGSSIHSCTTLPQQFLHCGSLPFEVSAVCTLDALIPMGHISPDSIHSMLQHGCHMSSSQLLLVNLSSSA